MKKNKEILNQFSEYLSRIPSIGYALTYLLCIPIFAFVYWLLPYEFYHSTVKYESVLNSDADEILRGIREEIITEFKKDHGNFYTTEGNWSLNITSIHVHSLKPESERTKFSIRLELCGINQFKGVQSIIPLEVSIENEKSFASYSPGDKWSTVFKRPVIENVENLQISARLIFPRTLVQSSLPANAADETVWFPISEPLHDKILAFSYTVKGFPAKASGSYNRMFYFSAVTITTLGYGDIVPITNKSRILVAAESILGIVLIGLFLNSLSREYKNA